MATIIGSARIGENGSITGGSKGDQKQYTTPDYSGEVSLQNFYVHRKGWNIIRIKNAKQAEKCGKAMRTACNNKNIGYNQNDRYGVVSAGTATTKKVNSDCSSLVRTCFKEATGVDPGDFSTSSEVSALKATGLVTVKSYTSGTKLYTGDILVTKTKGHTVIVTNGISRTGDEEIEVPSGVPILKKGSKGVRVEELQECLNKLGFKGKDKKALDADGDFGDNTFYALKQFQKKHKLEVDGEYGPASAKVMQAEIDKLPKKK